MSLSSIFPYLVITLVEIKLMNKIKYYFKEIKLDLLNSQKNICPSDSKTFHVNQGVVRSWQTFSIQVFSGMMSKVSSHLF